VSYNTTDHGPHRCSSGPVVTPACPPRPAAGRRERRNCPEAWIVNPLTSPRQRRRGGTWTPSRHPDKRRRGGRELLQRCSRVEQVLRADPLESLEVVPQNPQPLPGLRLLDLRLVTAYGEAQIPADQPRGASMKANSVSVWALVSLVSLPSAVAQARQNQNDGARQTDGGQQAGVSAPQGRVCPQAAACPPWRVCPGSSVSTLTQAPHLLLTTARLLSMIRQSQ